MPRLTIDTPHGRRVVTVRGSVGSIQAALDTLGRVADRDVAEGAGHPYDRGIRYRAERGEEWRRPWRVAEAGEGDCEDLAAWVAAYRRAEGAEGTRAVLVPTGPRTLHAVVRLPDGSIEDPSARCGMAGRLLRGPRVAVRRRGAGYAARVWLPAGYMIVVGDGTGPTPADAYAAACLVACGKLQAFDVAADPGDWTVSGVADSAYERIGEIADTIRDAATDAARDAATDALGGALADGALTAAPGWASEAKQTIEQAIAVFQASDAAARERRSPDRWNPLIIDAGLSYSGARAAAIAARPGTRPTRTTYQLPPWREDWEARPTIRERFIGTMSRVLVDRKRDDLKDLPTATQIAWCLAAGVAPVNFGGNNAARDAAREVAGDDAVLWASQDAGAGLGEWTRGSRSAWRYWAWVGLPELPAEVQAAADVWSAGGPEGSELSTADAVSTAIAICLNWSHPAPTDRDQIVQRLGLLVAAARRIRDAGPLAPDAPPDAPPRRDSPAPMRRDVPRHDSPPATNDGRPLMTSTATEAAGRLRAIADAATEADAGWAGLRAVAETLQREGPRSPYARLIRALVNRR